jgi:exodeoxyribonuclease VII large subunit
MRTEMRRRLQERMQRIDILGRRLVHPGERLGRLRAETAHLATRLDAGLRQRIGSRFADLQRLMARFALRRPDLRHAQRDLDEIAGRLRASASAGLSRQANRLAQLAASLDHLSPQAVLQRGFSLVRKHDGSIVRDAAQLTVAEPVQLTFGTGAAEAQVTRLKGR